MCLFNISYSLDICSRMHCIFGKQERSNLCVFLWFYCVGQLHVYALLYRVLQAVLSFILRSSGLSHTGPSRPVCLPFFILSKARRCLLRALCIARVHGLHQFLKHGVNAASTKQAFCTFLYAWLWCYVSNFLTLVRVFRMTYTITVWWCPLTVRCHSSILNNYCRTLHSALAQESYLQLNS